MMEKVKLPKDVAEAIEYLRRMGNRNEFLVNSALGNTLGDKSFDIFKFATGDEENFNVLLSALVHGYGVELTPEERVKKHYDELDILSSKWAVHETLNILGIKVDGINDNA